MLHPNITIYTQIIYRYHKLYLDTRPGVLTGIPDCSFHPSLASPSCRLLHLVQLHDHGSCATAPWPRRNVTSGSKTSKTIHAVELLTIQGGLQLRISNTRILELHQQVPEQNNGTFFFLQVFPRKSTWVSDMFAASNLPHDPVDAVLFDSIPGTMLCGLNNKRNKDQKKPEEIHRKTHGISKKPMVFFPIFHSQILWVLQGNIEDQRMTRCSLRRKPAGSHV